MSKPAIIVDGLSKSYRIGHQVERYPTFRETLVRSLTGPIRRFRQLRAGGTGNGDSEETFWALKDVSFEVQPGEVMGIIGRNGAGKSTLLKVLSRITEPTGGRAILNGRVASLLEVGTGFHPELTGRENIYLNGAILGMKKVEIDRKFDDIVAFAEVEKFLDTPVKRYSSGMYVRLAFAVAAHLEPEILVVDEVLAVGDAEFQKKCMGKMQEVASGNGRTVLFVSHNMGAIVDLCDRSVLLTDGQLAAVGRSDKVVAQYMSQCRVLKGHVDLTEWRNERTGDGWMRLLYAETSDGQGQVCSQFAHGDTIVLRFGVRAKPGAQCIVGVSVRNGMNQLVLHLSNADDSAPLTMPAHSSEVVVSLPHLILNDGTYHVTIWLGDNLDTLHDRVGNCLSFVVDSSAQGQFRCAGMVRVSADWRVDEMPRQKQGGRPIGAPSATM